MKRNYLLISLIVGLVLSASAVYYSQKEIELNSLTIVGENGGESGFDNISMKCNDLGKRITAKLIMKGAGYEKLELCPMLQEANEIKPILDLFSHRLDKNQPIDTIYTLNTYKVKMKIQNRGNFWLEVK